MSFRLGVSGAEARSIQYETHADSKLWFNSFNSLQNILKICLIFFVYQSNRKRSHAVRAYNNNILFMVWHTWARLLPRKLSVMARSRTLRRSVVCSCKHFITTAQGPNTSMVEGGTQKKPSDHMQAELCRAVRRLKCRTIR